MINLWDGYTITADEYQFILGKLDSRMAKDGKVRNNIIGATYHSTVGKALGSFYKLKTMECVRNNEMTIAEHLQAAKQIEERIYAFVKEPCFIENISLGEASHE